MDLAGGEDYAHTFREEFLQRGYSLWLPPTVSHELLHASETKSDPDAALAFLDATNERFETHHYKRDDVGARPNHV
jgi:hypothetical protein